MRIMTDYTATRKIASYEVNLFGELRLSTVLRICQEVAEEHLTMYQMDHVTLMKTQNLAFLILRVGMNINRLPKDGETITVLTRPEGNSGAQFYRSYKICVGQEELMDIMYSNILVDSTTHKIAHPSRLDYLKIDIKQTLSPKQKLNKLKIPEDMESWGIRQIRFSDLDFNGHMSNSIYASTMARPEMLLMEVWLGTRKKYTAAAMMASAPVRMAISSAMAPNFRRFCILLPP